MHCCIILQIYITCDVIADRISEYLQFENVIQPARIVYDTELSG